MYGRMLIVRVLILVSAVVLARSHGITNPVELIQRENARVELCTFTHIAVHRLVHNIKCLMVAYANV